MRGKDVEVGKWYRDISNDYGYFKALEVLKPGEGNNKSRATMVKCLHSPWGFNDKVGRIRHIKPANLERIKINR